jgi:alanyl-tRNA synthetase
LADASYETTRLHTSAHLLLEALRRVLGDHVIQKGSNITADRLRFDFSHPDKLTDEQKKQVEHLVNGAINSDLPVSYQEMPLDDAKKIGAMGVFESKYGEKVKVYTVGEGDNIFSREICGGPHVKRTSELGRFRIKRTVIQCGSPEDKSSIGLMWKIFLLVFHKLGTQN